MGYCMVHQWSSHPRNSCRKRKNLYICYRRRTRSQPACSISSILHHWWSRRGIRVHDEWKKTKGLNSKLVQISWSWIMWNIRTVPIIFFVTIDRFKFLPELKILDRVVLSQLAQVVYVSGKKILQNLLVSPAHLELTNEHFHYSANKDNLESSNGRLMPAHQI